MSYTEKQRVERETTIGLMSAIMHLMSLSSSNVEDTARTVLYAVACYLESSATEGHCGGLNRPSGMARAGAEEYLALGRFRAHFRDRISVGLKEELRIQEEQGV